MAFNLSNPIGTGTDSELLEFTRAAIAQITLHGQAYTNEGRQLTRADLASLREQLVFFESRVNQSNGRRRDNLAALQRAS